MKNLKPTEQQIEIARLLGIAVSQKDTFRILKGKINDFVAPAIGQCEKTEPTEKEIEVADSLALQVKGSSRRVLYALIGDELDRLNLAVLKELKLDTGDTVTIKTYAGNAEYIIASIGENGKIYFKGIGCPETWAINIVNVRKMR